MVEILVICVAVGVIQTPTILFAKSLAEQKVGLPCCLWIAFQDPWVLLVERTTLQLVVPWVLYKLILETEGQHLALPVSQQDEL